MPSRPYVTATVTISAAAALSSALDTEGWMVAAVELPSGFEGAFLSIRTGSAADTCRRVFLSDSSAANPAFFKLPSALASEAVVLQIEPLLTLGRNFVQLRAIQADGATDQNQAANRTVTLFLVKPGTF